MSSDTKIAPNGIYLAFIDIKLTVLRMKTLLLLVKKEILAIDLASVIFNPTSDSYKEKLLTPLTRT